jgi:hypothetical protein
MNSVEREYTAISPRGNEVKSSVKVYLPQLQPDGGWGCSISLGEMESEDRLIRGLDSWHTLQLGMHFVFLRLESLEKSGWKIRWFDNTEGRLTTLLPPVGERTFMS